MRDRLEELQFKNIGDSAYVRQHKVAEVQARMAAEFKAIDAEEKEKASIYAVEVSDESAKESGETISKKWLFLFAGFLALLVVKYVFYT